MTVSTRKGMLDLTPNAITVLERRYLVKDDHGAPVEGPEDLFWRGARPPPPPPPPGGGGGGGGGAAGGGLFVLMGAPPRVANAPPPTQPRPPPRPPAARSPLP